MHAIRSALRHLEIAAVVPSAALLVVALTVSLCEATTITIYTDKNAWENAVGGQFTTEGFSDEQLNEGVSFESSQSGHINPAQQCYQDVLASNSSNEPQTIWHFATAIRAYGGQWTLGGPGGSGNSLLVYLPDESLYVGFISNGYNGEFWGFTSDTPFQSVRLVGGFGTNQQNYSLDDMVYSQVPEPGAAWLLAGGIPGLLVWSRRRARP